MVKFTKDRQYIKFCAYGFLKNLRFFDAFLILFLLEKGLNYTEIGILYAVREIFINIFEVPSGIIADTYGRKNSLLASLFLYISSFLFFYISNDFWLFLTAFILFGIGDAFRTGTHKGIIMNYLEKNNWNKQKINYYGHTRSWSQKGSAISSLFAGLIVFYSGNYQNIFLYSIIPYVLNLLLIMSYPKELNRSLKQHAQKNKIRIGTTFKSFFNNIKQPNVFKIVNMSAVHSAYLKAVKDYIQPLMVNIALLIPIMLNFETDRKNGIIIGVLYFFIYILTSFASRFASKAAEKNKKNISYITLLCGFVCGITCGIFYIYELWVISLIAFVGIYIIENIRKPILTGFIADNVENEVLASVISVESLLKTIMTAIIALTFGLIADNYGIGTAFVALTSFLLFSSIAINNYKNKKVF
jgi:MFS family permease